MFERDFDRLVRVVTVVSVAIVAALVFRAVVL